ncbi:MAG: hypothetical protein K0U79_09020 [Gammaproteobacteria bacterium]|jgi:transposase|nr:hypothetical protein [Gammaproteobacteria bacterium]
MPKPMRPEIQTQVMPEPALEKRSRRSFTTEYKLKILSQADQCARGELGALLRKEKLYSNQLQQWRREFAERGIAGLAKTAPGPQARLTPEQREVEQLRKQNQRLLRQLEVANGCLDLQKKALSMMELAKTGRDE